VSFSAGDRPVRVGWHGRPLASDSQVNPVDSALVDALLTASLEATKREWADRFTLVGPLSMSGTRPFAARNDTDTLKDAIKRSGADFGMAAYHQFGWIWFPLRTGIANYIFRIRTAVFDREGTVVWEFLGKGNIPSPKLFDNYPEPPSITLKFEPLLSNYPRFLLLLLEEDIAGRRHGARFPDYFGLSLRELPVYVYNDADKAFLPQFPAFPDGRP
jgi:hypothetical protein